MKRLTGIIGFLCGIGAGIFVLLNNPLSPPAYSAVADSDAYQWKALEFFGISFTPNELLHLSSGSSNRSLGAKEVGLASASIVLLLDTAGQPVALATRLTAMNKAPDMYAENVGVDTYTNIFWPNAGSVLMHGYENRWPLIRNNLVALTNDAGQDSAGLEVLVSAVRPDKAPTGIVGGSGLFTGVGGRYSETIWQDSEQPDLYTGAISLEISVN
jgi:hypothetical protein